MLDKRRFKTVSLMCLVGAIGAVMIFLSIIALVGFDISDAGIIFPAFVAMAVAMCTVIMIVNFSNESIIRRIVAQTIMTVFTFVIMYGVYGLVNFLFLRIAE